MDKIKRDTREHYFTEKHLIARTQQGDPEAFNPQEMRKFYVC